jgi:hypothetical protein
MDKADTVNSNRADEARRFELAISQFSRRLSWVLFLAPALWCGLVVFAGIIYPGRFLTSDYLIWSISSLGLFLSTIVVLWAVDKKLGAAASLLEAASTKAMGEIAQDIRKYLDISVIIKETAFEMKELLLPELIQFANSNDKEFLIIGADTLRLPSHQLEEYRYRLEHEQQLSPEEHMALQYASAFERIIYHGYSNKIVQRFILLLGIHEFSRRTRDFQTSYLAWLHEQANMLRINRNYVLVDTPRAQVWGSPLSVMFFGTLVAQTFFAGGGMLIASKAGRVDDASSILRRLLIDNHLRRSPGPPVKEYSQLNLSQFEEYIAELQSYSEVS